MIVKCFESTKNNLKNKNSLKKVEITGYKLVGNGPSDVRNTHSSSGFRVSLMIIRNYYVINYIFNYYFEILWELIHKLCVRSGDLIEKISLSFGHNMGVLGPVILSRKYLWDWVAYGCVRSDDRIQKISLRFGSVRVC